MDLEGNTKWALSYGMKYTELAVWYHLEDVKNFFHKWTMPSKSRWVNLHEWKKYAKVEPFKPKTGSRNSSRNRASGNNSNYGNRGSRSKNRGSSNSGNRGSGIGR